MAQIAVGHLSRGELSAVVLATSFANVFGLSIMVGLSSAMETLCGQVRSILTGQQTHASLGHALEYDMLARLATSPKYLVTLRMSQWRAVQSNPGTGFCSRSPLAW